METGRNDLLGELARDAELERSDFIVQATEQLRKFLDANRSRISGLGGMTLIDEDPDYLSIAPDLTFRSRSRYLDEDTGEWVSDTEVLESAAEVVELYNPSDVFAAFAEAAREAAGKIEPTAAEELFEVAGIGVEETGPVGEDPYVAAADDWAAAQPADLDADDEETAARRLYDLALDFQGRSQHSEARLIEQFETAAERLTGKVGDLIVVDDEDERLVLESSGNFRAEVVPEDADGEWRTLTSAEEIVEFYDPTDIFGDLADALAEAFPAVAPEDQLEAADEEGEEAEAEAESARSRRRTKPTRTRPTRTAPRAARPRDHAPGCRGAHREPRDSAGPMDSGLPRTRPGQRLARRPVRARAPGGLLGARAAAAVLAEYDGRRHGGRHDPLPGHRAGHRLVHPSPDRRPDRHARPARPAVRGGSTEPPPAARGRRPGDGRRPDARRRGDP